jgi:AraC family transcriptional regulator, activator of mtrCDE
MSDRPTTSFTPADVLDELLRAVSFRAQLAYHGQVCDAWSLDTSGTGNVSFHLIGHGSCWLHLPSVPAPVRLHGGDVVMFPRDAQHVLAPEPQAEPSYGVRVRPREAPIDRSSPGVALICGFVEVDPGARQLLLTALPDYLIVRSATDSANRPLRTLLELMVSEASGDNPGTRAILERLADALFFYVLRESTRQSGHGPGFLAALADPLLRPSVTAMCRDPARDLGLDQLAALCAMSRSAFAERFHTVAGTPPGEFLTRWRMQLARRWLRDERVSVPEAAERCGYISEAAFAKAFKRVIGVGPGAVRRAPQPS